MANIHKAPDALTEAELSTGREYIARAQAAVKAYAGTEATHRLLMDNLIKLERWIVDAIGAEKGKKPPLELEREVLIKLAPEETIHTIDGLLGAARERFVRLMENPQDAEADMLGNLPVLVVQLLETILPPGESPGIQAGEFGEPLRERETMPRLQLLMVSLERRGIFADDIVLVHGKNLPTMMRTQSYVLVEIPRLGKQILICDEVGEATFVSEHMRARDVFLRYTKEQLLEKPGMHWIIFNNLKQWEEDIDGILFGYEKEEMPKKINVVDREVIGADLRKRFTPETWASMPANEKIALTSHVKKIKAIATLFGIEGNPIRHHHIHLALGRIIFGDHPAFNVMHDAELKEKIFSDLRTRFTPQAWASMQQKAKKALTSHGKKLNAIATLFGIQGDPVCFHAVHLALGRAIFGEHHLFTVIDEDTRRQEIQLDLLTRFTPERWACMRQKEKCALESHERKLKAIATLFGIEGGPVGNHAVHLALGRAIFGEHHLFTVIDEDTRRQEIQLDLLTRFTPERWACMRQKEKCALESHGQKLKAIATLLRIEGNPIGNHSIHLRLGRAIFGDHPAFERSKNSQSED